MQEETLTNESGVDSGAEQSPGTTAEVTPPPVMNDPWSHLSPEEKIEREIAFRQAAQRPSEPEVPSWDAEDEYGQKIVSHVEQRIQAQMERARREQEQRMQPYLAHSARDQAVARMSEGLDDNERAAMLEVIKDFEDERPETLLGVAQDPKVVNLFKAAAKMKAMNSPKRDLPPGRTGQGQPSGDLKEVKDRLKKQYGFDVTDEEAKAWLQA